MLFLSKNFIKRGDDVKYDVISKMTSNMTSSPHKDVALLG